MPHNIDPATTDATDAAGWKAVGRRLLSSRATYAAGAAVLAAFGVTLSPELREAVEAVGQALGLVLGAL